MKHPEKILNAFPEFVHSVSTGPRHYLNQSQIEFLEHIASCFSSRAVRIKKGDVLFRCQKVVNSEPREFSAKYSSKDLDIFIRSMTHDLHPVHEDRMRPLSNQALEGRANPKGIPIFYCSEHPETAVCETRAIVKENVTVGEFKACDDLHLVSFAKHDFQMLDAIATLRSMRTTESQAEESLCSVALDIEWYEIGKAFSKPVERTDHSADYAPTQIIAELVKSKGYDGIAYESSLCGRRGLNYALYDGNRVEFSESYVMTVRSVRTDVELYKPDNINP